MRYSENQLNMKNLLLLVCVITAQLTFAKLNIPETPFTEYKFESKECKVIQHNKSRIFVQPYTFYLDGKVYDGQVNLKYREFVDQLDIVLNHIPMSYNENDKQHVLESGGMFELMAYGNGKLLSFAPNKKVQVQLASNFDVTGGETFVLNRQTNTWAKEHLSGNQRMLTSQAPIINRICGEIISGRITKVRILFLTQMAICSVFSLHNPVL